MHDGDTVFSISLPCRRQHIHTYNFYPMNENVQPPNIKDICNARYQNPKFVYDGKRMRVLTVRKMLDYSSSYIYEKHFHAKPIECYLETSSHLLYLRQPKNSPQSQALTTKFAHISINKYKCPINIVRWTPDGRRLMTGTSTGEFTLWNGFSFNFETILQAHESPVGSMCWTPSAKFLVSGDNLGIVKYWHPSMLNLQKFYAHSEPVRDISFAHTDSKFCTASDDGKIKVWDFKECKEEGRLEGHGWDVRVAQWHPTKALVASGGKDNLVKLWDPRARREIMTAHLHRNTILALKWSLDGNYLLTAGKDQVIKMLDLNTLKEAFTYKGHKKEVTSLTIHPHIKDLFVSGGAEGGLYFWQMFDEHPLEIVDGAHETTIWGLDFHPLGHVLASGSMDNSCRFWTRERPEDSGTSISATSKFVVQPRLCDYIDAHSVKDDVSAGPGREIPGLLYTHN